MEYKIKKMKLCEIIWNGDTRKFTKKDLLFNYIKNSSRFDENQLKIIEKKLINSFIPDYDRKWNNTKRKRSNFIVKYQQFLESDFVVNFSIENDEPSEVQSCSSLAKRGRPRVTYEKGASKTKKRRIEELSSSFSREELVLAIENVEIVSDNESDTEDPSELTEELMNNTLAMFVDLKLSKRKYLKLRKYNKIISKNNSYPSYNCIVKAKNNCYPFDGEHIETSVNGASAHFISLLGHTVERILLQFKKSELTELHRNKLILKGKWGMDGAHSNQMTNQKWSKDNYDDDNIDRDSDAAFFLISFVPLQLETADKIIWTNKTPSSVHYCRITKFVFAKERESLVKKEYEYHNNLLNKVETYSITLNGIVFDINFDLKCTMIDGKICNYLTNQKASACCNICGVGPKYANDLSYITKLHFDESHYKFGLSTLHMWIRTLEFLLHVSYNQDFKQFFARTLEEKEQKKQRKQQIQNDLKSELSLTVDKVRQGYGTSNTGNVARAFMRQAEAVSKIVGLDENLIVRFHNILQVITCGKMIDTLKFKQYCLQTFERHLHLYPWYKLPPSIHKLLIHGADIIETFDLPIGYYSEESQEGSNKVFRDARSYHSRMNERSHTNIDILKYMLVNSDPLVSSCRLQEKKSVSKLTDEAQNMLL